MKTWENAVLQLANYTYQQRVAEMDRLGKLGWEMVTIEDNVGYFKREVKEEVNIEMD